MKLNLRSTTQEGKEDGGDAKVGQLMPSSKACAGGTSVGALVAELLFDA
eukprot:CAMPEP_0206504224 /NCGR_PEP_ID=MMETSP0324_2-20121206/55332_1 /ASSEMBLY_ACC=CAM_ASM_000836 /TAXON_ID=2866 /ORGANISM="Crypthecodinium cohnii, Strain Seligo" /LENGTH=48 /DNA_ID= /DNA_START= /DNA_END= /DNA_ORIENTATION=